MWGSIALLLFKDLGPVLIQAVVGHFDKGASAPAIATAITTAVPSVK